MSLQDVLTPLVVVVLLGAWLLIWLRPRRVGGDMRLDPDRVPITRPVFVWFRIVARLDAVGDVGLAAAIRQAMDGRRLGDNATFALTVDEQQRVDAVLQDWLGESDPA